MKGEIRRNRGNTFYKNHHAFNILLFNKPRLIILVNIFQHEKRGQEKKGKRKKEERKMGI
jgi:hypothetical protein